jgi:hypothetical protein
VQLLLRMVVVVLLLLLLRCSWVARSVQPSACLQEKPMLT